MAWKGIVYGNLAEVRRVALDWAEYRLYNASDFSFQERELFASDRDEGLPGVEIKIDARVNPPQIAELLSRLRTDAGCRAYVWRTS